MFKLFRNQILESPIDSNSGSAGIADKLTSSSELNKSDILDFLNRDDDEPLLDEKKDDKEPKEKKDKDDKEADKSDEEDKEEDEVNDGDDEDDDLKALEEELEEPDEEKLELSTPTSRREILKKYPTIFKDFPGLEKAYYREHEFTKLLPTIDDAKEAVAKSQTLDNLEKDLTSGDTLGVLTAIKKGNPEAFNKIADEYLSTLAKVDKDACNHVIGNVIRQTIISMVKESRASQNEALESAATILNQFIFASSQFEAPKRLSSKVENPESDAKEKRIAEREKAFLQQRFNSVNGELNSKINGACKSYIEKNIDPKGSMSDYVKRNATREAIEELESLVSKDSRFVTLKDKLWEKAIAEDFNPQIIAKIKSAFVSKAQTLLPAIIKKHRSEALKGMGVRSKDSNDRSKDDDSHQSDESNNGNDSGRRKESNKGDESHRRKGSKKEIPHGMSSYEYLMSDD